MSKPRKSLPRLWLIFIFCALAAADYFFWIFSFHELNPYPITRGLTFGSALWSVALLIAMWLRKGWARYVLIGWLVMAMVAFSMIVMLMEKQSVSPLPEPTHIALQGLGLYALALVPLSVAGSLRRFLAPRTAGGL